MRGISSKAAGGLVSKKGYNGNELQDEEFCDGSGLEVYDFNARTYDHQLGRFIQVDSMTDEDGQEIWSPYHFSYNNPLRFSDPDGKFPIPLLIPLAIKAVEATIVTYAAYKASQALKEPIKELADNISDRVNSRKTGETGSYTNTHQSGKKYHGKGDEARAAQSAKEKEKTYEDPLVNTEWNPAKNDKEAFKDEAQRLRDDGGYKNPNNYNKRNSPGEKELKKQDAASKSDPISNAVQAVAVPIVVATVKFLAWITQ